MIAAKQLNAGAGTYGRKQIGPQPGQTQVKQVSVLPIDTSSASASVGTFPTSANKFSVAGAAGPDIANNTAHGVMFEVVDIPPATAQTFWSYASTTTGWYFSIDHNSNNISIIVRNGGVSTAYIVPSYNLNVGEHVVWWTRGAGNTIRMSIDGEVAFSLTAAFAYSMNGAGAQNIMGGVNTSLVASGFPCTAGNVLGTAYLNTNLSDSDLQTFSNQVNLTERYQWPAAVTGHANAVSVWSATDWDGASGATTAGHGSAPTTWTRIGALTKNTIKAENVFSVELWWWSDASDQMTRTYQTGIGTYTFRNAFARFGLVLSSSPDRIGVGVAADTEILPAGFFPQTGLRVDGVPAGVAGNGVPANGNGLLRNTDWLPGNFQAGTTFEFIDGLNGRIVEHGIRRGTSIQTIRLPTDVTITSVVAPAVVSNLLMICGDSIPVGSGILAPNTSSWTTLLRQIRGEVKLWSAGSEEYWDLCNNAAAITAAVADIGLQLNGVTTNEAWFTLGVNDWGNSVWLSAFGDFETQVAALFDAIHAAYPALLLRIVTPIPRNPEGANAHGNTLQDFRDALAAIQAPRAAWLNITNGVPLCPFTTGASAVQMLQTGSAHPTQVGHSYIARRACVILGLTEAYPWNSSGFFRDTNVPYSWVADAAFTGGGPTVATWLAQKGGVNIAGIGNPTFAADYGSEALGGITLNGVNQELTGDPIASLVSGANKPFTLIFSIRPIVVAIKIFGSFDRSTTAAQSIHDFGMTTGPSRLTDTRKGDAGVGLPLTTTQTINTDRQVWTIEYDGTNSTLYINGTVTSITSTPQDKNPMTVDQFTVGAFRGGGAASLNANIEERSLLFIPAILDSTSRQICEGFSMSEAV